MPPRASRLTRLFQRAGELDAILIVNEPRDPSFFWASGLHQGGTFEGSALVLRPDERPVVLTSPLEETIARKSANEVVLFSGKDGLKKAVRVALKGAERVGLDLGKTPVNRHAELRRDLPKVEFVDVGKAVTETRLVKDADEIEAIARACKITDGIADTMEEHVRDARTEAELTANVVHAILSKGAALSFDPIVACGPGSAEPHYQPGPVRLKSGAVLVDMGCRVDGYCSDITRTYSLGKPTKRLASMHATVLEAIEAAMATVRPGVAGGDVHEAAEAVIDESDFKGRFIHSTGHSLGVEVHDGPGLHPTRALTLAEGMVLTIEPGIYLPGEEGVRVEEDIVVTRSGCKLLTHARRDLRDLRA